MGLPWKIEERVVNRPLSLLHAEIPDRGTALNQTKHSHLEKATRHLKAHPDFSPNLYPKKAKHSGPIFIQCPQSAPDLNPSLAKRPFIGVMTHLG